jgi:AcrR family transcriptional regulator
VSSPSTPTPLLLEDRAGVAPPRQERSEVSTRRLLEAATELIAEVGYSGTTLATIGARAGYSRSLVTSRFGTKDNLVAVLLEQLTSAWLRYFSTPPPAEDGLQTLLALVRAVGWRSTATRPR